MATAPIRFVCISDTFGETPELPGGDVLIHAGNLTEHSTLEELQRTIAWIDSAKFKAKLIIAGDRDRCLDANCVQNSGKKSPVDLPYHHCPRPLPNAATIIYLNHESQTVNVRNIAGQEVKFKVFGTPFSYRRGASAFGCEVDEAFALWSDIPLDTDIRGFTGCRLLREALWRVRPRLVLCGREYAGRGVEVVRWALDEMFVKYKEDFTYHLNAPTSSHKQQRYNLSTTSRRPLKNDGAAGNLVPFQRQCYMRGIEVDLNEHVPSNSIEDYRNPVLSSRSKRAKETKDTCLVPSLQRKSTFPLGVGSIDRNTRTCDQEAILGREARLETVFANATYLPCERVPALRGSYRYNKPIVIDLDMPLIKSKDKWYIQEATRK